MDKSEDYYKMCDHPLIKEQRGFSNDEYTGHPVWLPRQEHLLEMLDVKDVDDLSWVAQDIFYVSEGGCHYNYDPPWRVYDMDGAERFDSIEQLWLGYYMHRRHGLIWNRDKWESNG